MALSRIRSTIKIIKKGIKWWDSGTCSVCRWACLNRWEFKYLWFDCYSKYTCSNTSAGLSRIEYNIFYGIHGQGKENFEVQPHRLRDETADCQSCVQGRTYHQKNRGDSGTETIDSSHDSQKIQIGWHHLREEGGTTKKSLRLEYKGREQQPLHTAQNRIARADPRKHELDVHVIRK